MIDTEWALVGPLIPLTKRDGGKRMVNMREVVNDLMYGSFDLWIYEGTIGFIHHAPHIRAVPDKDR